MESAVINTRADLDAVAGTPAHAALVASLAATLWRVERDDTAGVWVAVEDDSTIARFGFVRADFPDAAPPTLPAYISSPSRTAADLYQALAQIDMRSIRALREGDTARIASLETEAAALRAELAGLSDPGAE